MTAVNIFCRPEAAYVLTDGAATAPDGTVVQLVQKVIILGHLNAVVASRGHLSVLFALLPTALTSAGSFDELAALFPEAIGGLAASAEEALKASPHPWIETYLCGWSEGRNAAVTWYAGNSHKRTTDYFGDLECWSTTGPITSPLGPNARDRLAAAGLDPKDGAFDPVTQGFALMDAQRADPDAAVGGFCQLTTITRDGVSSRVIGRWTEQPGGMIVA